ncbi:hypothetical protein PRIPAC_73057 [Pristionchus pacificus]|uniref:Skp1-related protein n=1 Tax=Pristionchus pacificus TaxID=54126 RepID=A0A2A6C982_PRIPA|nr:hypothetical protein PRIPAC_73057 [Pristionchus pacificus]|eukprot:PDM74571.1 hypothetical protein PRIPAC_41927 [Pristionchus pacificus]
MVLITLVSSDEQNFPVERELLKQSGTIETLIVNMNLDDEDTDAAAMPIPLPNVKGDVLEKVIQWMEHHKGDPVKEGDNEDNNAEIVVPQWDDDFFKPAMYGSKHLELTVAASYLDIKNLLTLSCKAISNTFKGKTGPQIREEWGVPNEFTPEEEEAIRKENEWSE